MRQLRKMPSRCVSCVSANSRETAERDSVDVVSCTGEKGTAGLSSSAAAAVRGNSETGTTVCDIPIVSDAHSFEESLAVELQKLDELADAERRRQRRRWREEVDMMREEIVPLDVRPASRRCRSQSPTTYDTSPIPAGVVEQRRLPRLPRNYFRRFFDTSGFNQQTIRVLVERGTLVLGIDKLPEQSECTNNCDAMSVNSRTTTRTRYYRFPIPAGVDLATIQAVLSTDAVLLVEASTGTGTLSSPDQSLGSLGVLPPITAKREKLGKPIFHDDEDGKRRMRLLVDVGDSFRPKDVYVQAIKSDRFQVCRQTILLFLKLYHGWYCRRNNEHASLQRSTKFKY